MKTKLIVLVSIMSFFMNISGLFAGTWIKKTEIKAGANENESEITNDRTPESSSEGLYAKNWADGNDVGISITGWLLTRDKIRPSINEIKCMFGGHALQEFQWSERNPPRMAFSCNWTEVLYVQNKGNCDNGQLFNNKGMAKASASSTFNLASGPEHTMDKYQINYNIYAENRENKVIRSPEAQVEKEKEDVSIGWNWDNKPDKKKSWEACGGNIVSFSVGMDNLTSDNILSYGGIGSDITVKLQNKAKSSLASVFQELSGFDLVMDGEITNTQVSISPFNQSIHYAPPYSMREIWRTAARQSDLSSDSLSNVDDFLRRILVPSGTESLDEGLVTESIKRYLKQFGYTFQGERRDQACYYMAWLLAEAASKAVPSPDNNEKTRVSFETFTDKLINILDENAKQAIADTNSSKIQEELNENLARVKGSLMYYFYELREDPLFPLFKTPVDSNVAETVIGTFKNEKILFNLLNNQVKDRPVDDFYAKWLSFYFDRVAERAVFWLAIDTNKDKFRDPRYWGGMHYTAKSSGSGLWPMEIYLTRMNDK